MDALSPDLAAPLKVDGRSFSKMFIPLPAVFLRSCPSQGMSFIPSLLKFIAIAVANTLLATVWLLLSVLTALFHLVPCSPVDYSAGTPQVVHAAAGRIRRPRRQDSGGSAATAVSRSSADTVDSGDATLHSTGALSNTGAQMYLDDDPDAHKEHELHGETSLGPQAGRCSRRPCVRRLLPSDYKLLRLHTSPGTTRSTSSLPKSPIQSDTASTISAPLSHPAGSDSSEPRTRFTSLHALQRAKSTPNESAKPIRAPRCARHRHTVPEQKQTRPAPRTNPYQAPYFFPSPMSPDAADYVRQVKTERRAPSRSASASSGQAEVSTPARRLPEARETVSASSSPIKRHMDLPDVHENDVQPISPQKSRRRSWHLHLPLHHATHINSPVPHSATIPGADRLGRSSSSKFRLSRLLNHNEPEPFASPALTSAHPEHDASPPAEAHTSEPSSPSTPRRPWRELFHHRRVSSTGSVHHHHPA